MIEKRKKILFLITKSNWGGAQRYVFDLATTLDLEKFEPVVALGERNEPNGSFPPSMNEVKGQSMLNEMKQTVGGILKTKLEAAGIKTISISGLERDISLLKEVQAIFAIARILRQEKPDVLHVNSSKAGALGACLGRMYRVPRIIFTAHGWSFNENRPYWQKIILKSIHWLTIAFSHHTIAVSNATKAQMNWPLTQKKITVINPGRTITDLKTKQEARGILETKIIDSVANLTDYHTDLWVGTIAELHPIKQLNRAIDSIASLSRTIPQLRYIIIGSGQSEKILKQQVQNLGIQQHVFFTGAIDEAARLLPSFDVFILPSKSEAYGYVLLEAGLALVPVVATNVGGVVDIITNNKTGLLVSPKSTLDLTSALRKLLSDPYLRDNLSSALKEKVQDATIEKMTSETTNVYDT